MCAITPLSTIVETIMTEQIPVIGSSFSVGHPAIRITPAARFAKSHFVTDYVVIYRGSNRPHDFGPVGRMTLVNTLA